MTVNNAGANPVAWITRPATTGNSTNRRGDALSSLTSADKQLLNGSAGWDVDSDAYGEMASEDAKRFAGQIMRDRAVGKLSGEVDSTYLSDLMQQQARLGEELVPASVLSRALSFLEHLRTGIYG
jgi:hypothetical protein